MLDDEPATTNYALRLTEAADEDVQLSSSSRRGLGRPKAPPAEADSFALKLSEALEAISSAQDQPELAARPTPPEGKMSWLGRLDRLPPIKLPIGPPIPWRLGLPVFVALIIVMGVMSRTASSADTQGVQLPVTQPTPTDTLAPLFASAQPTPSPTLTTNAQDQGQAQTQTPAPGLGVQDPGLGFDVVDLGIKLIAVLALAYGSLMLLKRFGVGGVGGARNAVNSQSMRVVSSLVLAPNRSVHVIKAPGGRTLLIGATVNSVNLLADLGELADDEIPDSASLIDALKDRIGR